MATVVYKPEDKSGLAGFAHGLGQGMSAGLLKEFEKRERQERIRSIQSSFEGIRTAAASGGRAAALEAANATLSMAEDPADVRTILSYVDQVAPMDEFQQVPIVDQDNNPSVAFVPKQKLGQLNTPEGSGLLPQGSRVGVPEDEYEFLLPPKEEGGTPTFAGKAPMSKKPEGAITSKEFQFGQEIAASRRADKTLDIQGKRLEQDAEQHQETMAFRERSEARAERADARADARARQQISNQNRSAQNQTADNFRADANRARQTLLSLGGKQLADGSFSFTEENEKKLFAQRMPYVEKRLQEEYEKGKGVVNVASIIDEALQKYPGSESKPPEELAPPAPSSGKKKHDDEGRPSFLSRANEAARGVNEALGLSEPRRLKGTPEEVQQQFDALPPGATFIGPDGKRYKKKK